jgi:predicted ATPase
MFLTHSIGVLPEDVKSSLCVLSCFGSSVESTLIKVLERGLDKKFLDNLDVAVAEGFLDKINDQYRFSHDRIQEAAYNMMNVEVRRVRHFQYGIALSNLLIGVEGDGILFTAANQLNIGGTEAVEHNSQYILVANLNLRAGKKAIEMSDFKTAYSYFDHGITFLPKNHWKERYSLSLELFDLASKCALANGDFVSLTLLSDQVLLYGHSFEHKLNVLYYTTCSMASSLKLPESIEKGLDILAKLGIVLRGCDSSMEACVQETKNLLSDFTNDEILNTRRVTDPTMIMAMKFLGKLVLGMTQIIPKSVSFVTQKIIQLSLSHGLSPVSPIGFVHFGSCMAKLGDISGGYRYVKLALSLLDKVGSRESAGEVIIIGTHVRAYVEPLQAAIAHYDDGYAAAMTSGDTNIASLNRLCFYFGSFFAGVNLQILRKKYDETQMMMAERKQTIFLIYAIQFQRSVFKLIGVEEQPKYVSEEQTILATNISVMKTYYFSKTYISYMFRSYDDAKEYAEKYFACSETTWANLLLLHAQHAFYIGLTSFWLARMSWEQQRRRQWYQRGNQFKVALERWAESSRWTFENKWYLLEAEESYCNNDFKAAKSFYEKAISSAKDHKVR